MILMNLRVHRAGIVGFILGNNCGLDLLLTGAKQCDQDQKENSGFKYPGYCQYCLLLSFHAFWF
jgi:hypothetical protein